MVTRNVIVAFPKIEDARKIKLVLERNGFNVVAACSSGARALSITDHLDGGTIVCGYRLSDVVCTELRENLPVGFNMLMVASEAHWEEVRDRDIVFLPLPMVVSALCDTLNMMIETNARYRRRLKSEPRVRSDKDNDLILFAKNLLMDKNNMTENEAHKYIQKCSMDSGCDLVDTAKKVIDIYG